MNNSVLEKQLLSFWSLRIIGSSPEASGWNFEGCQQLI